MSQMIADVVSSKSERMSSLANRRPKMTYAMSRGPIYALPRFMEVKKVAIIRIVRAAKAIHTLYLFFLKYSS